MGQAEEEAAPHQHPEIDPEELVAEGLAREEGGHEWWVTNPPYECPGRSPAGPRRVGFHPTAPGNARPRGAGPSSQPTSL